MTAPSAPTLVSIKSLQPRHKALPGASYAPARGTHIGASTVNRQDGARPLAMQPDGGIIVARSARNGSVGDVGLVRILP
jgi:hypothetical protein